MHNKYCPNHPCSDGPFGGSCSCDRSEVAELLSAVTSNLNYAAHQYAIGTFGPTDIRNAIVATRTLLNDVLYKMHNA